MPAVVQQDAQQIAPHCAQLEFFFSLLNYVSIAFMEEAQTGSGPVQQIEYIKLWPVSYSAHYLVAGVSMKWECVHMYVCT